MHMLYSQLTKPRLLVNQECERADCVLLRLGREGRERRTLRKYRMARLSAKRQRSHHIIVKPIASARCGCARVTCQVGWMR
eukprot:6175791-Pleurochrysis_carterae.AAC.2